MKLLEIIHLRSSGASRAGVESLVEESIQGVEEPATVIAVYRRRDLETDLAVHIQRPAAPGAPAPSSLGLRLASALRAYGMVEHTLWEESR